MVADSRPEKIERTATFEASRDDVWTALTDAEALGAWYGGEVSIDPRLGGVVRITDGDGDRRGTVEDIEPGRRLVLRLWSRPGVGFGGTRIEFVVDPDGPATRLTVIESRLTSSAPRALAFHA